MEMSLQDKKETLSILKGKKCPYRMFCPLFIAWEDVFQFLVLSVSLNASPLLPRPTTLDEEVLFSNNWGRHRQGAGLMRMDNAAATLATLESVSAAGPTAATPLPPWAAGNGRWDGQLPQKRGCGTCVPEGLLWTLPLVHLLLPRGSRAQQPAPPGLDPPHGLPNPFLGKHLVCFPAFTSCPLIAGWRQGRGLDGILSRTQGHLIPALPFPQGPWRGCMKQRLLEPFMLGGSFPLAKIAWSLASQQAELRAMHWVDQCLEEKSLHFPSSPGGDQSWQLSSIYSAQFRCPV